MSIVHHHTEWLSLIEVSGPFLSMPVLLRVFPQGLDTTDPDLNRVLRAAYEEWADNQAGSERDEAIHTQWLRFVLANALGMKLLHGREGTGLVTGSALPPAVRVSFKEHGETLFPDYALLQQGDAQPRLLIQQYARSQHLNGPIPGRRWTDSPATRMMQLLHASEVRLGLVTNGDQWMLVDAPRHETTAFVTWHANLWTDEPLTLRAFCSLLHLSRFYGVAPSETLEELLRESASNQQEVTDQLGYQVRRAVEVLLQAFNRIDREYQERNANGREPVRNPFADRSETQLYEAALTVMMRLVFLLSAEERKLLPLDEELYNENYAASTLQAHLREQADQQGEEVLERRYDAWDRLLALFRMVHGGIEHLNLRLPAYGGHLFDPDRFPFLEGRASGSHWRESEAAPLLIDNRTVLHLLEALQLLQVRAPGSSSIETRRLSFSALDIEQIGHVYEGLLDHTARRATGAVLSLSGTGQEGAEVALAQLEEKQARGEETLLAYLKERTGRSLGALQKALATQHDLFRVEKFRRACEGDAELLRRVRPFAGLVRSDSFDNPLVIAPGSVYMTTGTDRRTSGTHYTPRSLTEPLVQHTLDPLVYIGPAEGLPPEQWHLRPIAEILDLTICDFAMGSGAFLVQACRYLSHKLVEAWKEAEWRTPGKRTLTIDGTPATGAAGQTLLPIDTGERLALARRLVAERCLYGVDKNPMAVEMAKLSLWLITLDRDRPFTFLDHDLLGISEARQLYNGSLDAKAGTITPMTRIRYGMDLVVDTIIQKRRLIAKLPSKNIQAVQEKERLLAEADAALEIVRLGGDLIIGIALAEPKRREHLQDILSPEYAVLSQGYNEALHQRQTGLGWTAKREKFQQMRAEVDDLLKGREPFHWPLEFPEVFIDRGDNAGFAALVSNPPFQGGQRITGALGTDYRDYLVEYLAHGKRGSADLCAYFFLRTGDLIRHDGQAAMLATNTIAQGDTREVGLDQLVANGWTIPRAVPSQKWPGTATLEIAQLWLKRGDWQGPYVLDEKYVAGITSYLTISGEILGTPYRLDANSNKSFIGSYVLGMGFVLEPTEAQALVEKNPKNRDVLFPYLNGEDLNSRSDQSPGRRVINFHNWPLERAEQYPDCMQIVREKVKPERDRNNRQVRRERWWQFAERAPALYSTIADMERVLVIALTSRTCAFIFEPGHIVFSHATGVFALDRACHFAVLQSALHVEWAFNYASTLKGDLRYTPSDCFETFPVPADIEGLDDIGERYYQQRQSIMLARQEGLTKTYNRFHNPREADGDIARLRELHREMDEAVAAAYGWDDLQLEHGFHETKQGLRYTISEEARREVLGRLLRLNHERYAEEVAQGLHEKGAKGKPGNGPAGRDGEPGQGRAKKGGRGKREQEKNADDVQQVSMFE